jgi:hypothetical protein
MHSAEIVAETRFEEVAHGLRQRLVTALDGLRGVFQSWGDSTGLARRLFCLKGFFLCCCPCIVPVQGRDNPLQVPIALHLPNLSRQGLPLDALQLRVSEPRSLSLDSAITRSSDGFTGQVGQTSPVISQLRGHGFGSALPFLILFVLCSLIVFRHCNLLLDKPTGSHILFGHQPTHVLQLAARAVDKQSMVMQWHFSPL